MKTQEYIKALREFDRRACETISVGQNLSGRIAHPTLGYSTHVFSRMGAHSVAVLNAAPKSRWSTKWWSTWDVSTVAGHIRAILEGHLLVNYLISAPQDEDTQRAYIHLMHLYDCTKRIKILPELLPADQIEDFKTEAERIKHILRSTKYFKKLELKKQKSALSGNYLMFSSQNEAAVACGFELLEFQFLWNYLSQYTHILSFQFYRLEPNSRGSGLKNQFDIDALHFALTTGARILDQSNRQIIKWFPDCQTAMRGSWSQFSPGPLRNSFLRKITKLGK